MSLYAATAVQLVGPCRCFLFSHIMPTHTQSDIACTQYYKYCSSHGVGLRLPRSRNRIARVGDKVEALKI